MKWPRLVLWNHGILLAARPRCGCRDTRPRPPPGAEGAHGFLGVLSVVGKLRLLVAACSRRLLHSSNSMKLSGDTLRVACKGATYHPLKRYPFASCPLIGRDRNLIRARISSSTPLPVMQEGAMSEAGGTHSSESSVSCFLKSRLNIAKKGKSAETRFLMNR